MAELVDALASGASVRNGVEVRVFSWAPIFKKTESYDSVFLCLLTRGSSTILTAAFLVNTGKTAKRINMKHCLFSLAAVFSILTNSSLLAQDEVIENHWNGKQYQQYSTSQAIDATALIKTLPTHNIKSIIDLGCGSGNSIGVLQKYFPNTPITGIDPDGSMLDIAKKECGNNKKITLIKDTALTFTCNQLADLVFSSHVMHWIPEKQQLKVLKNISNNMNRGGTLALVFSTSNKGLPFYNVLNSLTKQPTYSSTFKDFRPSQAAYQVDEYRNLLEQAGFFVSQIGYSFNTKPYKDSDELKLWIQQWLPHGKHLESKSKALRDHFMEHLIASYLEVSDQKNKSPIWWGEYVITAVAHKQPTSYTQFKKEY